MRYTNRLGLSPAWVEAMIAHDRAYREERNWDYHTTQLASPVRQQCLLERHWDDIVKDIVDCIPLIIGLATHDMLESAGGTECLIEHRFIINILGKTIGIKPDRADYIVNTDPPEYLLTSFKTTKLSQVTKGARSEWKCQANAEAFAARQQGFNITQIRVEAALKDWHLTEGRVIKRHGYPADPAIILTLTPWTQDYIQRWLEERVRLFESSRYLRDSDLPLCSTFERWAKPDRWAVVFSEGKSKGHAVKGGANFPERHLADEALEARRVKQAGNKKAVPCEVVFRKAESPRCEHYCDVAPFCNQYQRARKKIPF